MVRCRRNLREHLHGRKRACVDQPMTDRGHWTEHINLRDAKKDCRGVKLSKAQRYPPVERVKEEASSFEKGNSTRVSWEAPLTTPRKATLNQALVRRRPAAIRIPTLCQRASTSYETYTEEKHRQEKKEEVFYARHHWSSLEAIALPKTTNRVGTRAGSTRRTRVLVSG